MVSDGRVVPLLGAGVNLCGRPVDGPWQQDTAICRAAESLLTTSPLRSTIRALHDLVRISQYVSVVMGDAPLYDELHDVFAAEYEPTPLHRFLAKLPSIVRRHDPPPRLLSAHRDDELRRCARKRIRRGGENTISSRTSPTATSAGSSSTGHGRGSRRHRPAEQYGALSLERRTVILKVTGPLAATMPSAIATSSPRTTTSTT